MKVIKAQTAGFCFGVKRAVDQVYDLAAKEKEPVYTYGPIIHNEEVVRDLEEKGVRVLNGKEDLLSVKKGTVVIRSHGVAEEVYDLRKRTESCRCDLSICKENTSHCQAGRRKRKRDRDHRKCQSSGGRRHPRMVCF